MTDMGRPTIVDIRLECHVRRRGSFKEPHPLQQVAVAWIVPKAVKARIHFDPRQPSRMIVKGFIKPFKRGSLRTKAHVNDRDVKRRDVVLCRSRLQRRKGLLRLASLP